MCWPTPESQMSLLQANVKFFMVWAFRSVLKQDTQYSHYFPFIAMAACYCQGLTLRYSSDLFKCKMSGVSFTRTSLAIVKLMRYSKYQGIAKCLETGSKHLHPSSAAFPSLGHQVGLDGLLQWALSLFCQGFSLVVNQLQSPRCVALVAEPSQPFRGAPWPVIGVWELAGMLASVGVVLQALEQPMELRYRALPSSAGAALVPGSSCWSLTLEGLPVESGTLEKHGAAETPLSNQIQWPAQSARLCVSQTAYQQILGDAGKVMF